MRVLVKGGGIFGASAALELRRRGHDVALTDPGPLPHPKAASNDVSKVVRLEYGRDAFYTELAEKALQTWRAWGPPRYHETGVLFLTRDGAFERESEATLRARGHAVERLSRDEVAERFPGWDAEALFNAQGGWADAATTVIVALDEARAAGVVFGEGKTPDVTVVAAGAWTPKLLPHLSEVFTVRGMPIVFLDVDPGRYAPPRFPTWTAAIEATGFYGFPALPDGRLKISNHGVGYEADPDGPRDLPQAGIDAARAFVAEWRPELADAPVVDGRLCLYCDTPDGDFRIDRDPDNEKVVVAAGGSGHAFKFAPMLGPLIADAVEGKVEPRFAFATRRAGHGDAARAG